ncbi:GroES-like protein [Biscogniauxia mediterranea]|nr:GroES-like protein [Biscogniauxia mediterranea]
MATHKAAVAHAKDRPLKVEVRPTSKPGPDELLLDVKSIALNPTDVYSCDHDFALNAYPPSGDSRVCICAPNYGAFQERVIVPASNAAPIPDALGFNEAAKNIGISRDAAFGASSSVGTIAVQTARVFDYQEMGIEEAIVRAARGDRLTFQYGYDAVGALQSCLNVLKALKGDRPAHLASAPIPSRDCDPTENIEVKFVVVSADKAERTDEYTFWFNVRLKEKLASGELVPSPKIQVVKRGLAAINTGLDLLQKGVSCIKLVLEI